MRELNLIFLFVLLSNTLVLGQDTTYAEPDYSKRVQHSTLNIDSIATIKIVGTKAWSSKGFFPERLSDSICKNNNLPVYATFESLDSSLFFIEYKFRDADKLHLADTCTIYSWNNFYMALPLEHFRNHEEVSTYAFESNIYILSSSDQRDVAYYCKTKNANKIVLYQK